MESIGVLMTVPVNCYLEEALDKRFKLFRFWTATEKSAFLATHKDSIRAVVSKGGSAVDSAMIDSLPELEIVANHGVGLDKIDLGKCKEKGIRVTYTPDVLSDDVADLAMGLMLAVLRKVCASDRYVKSAMWKKGKFELTTKLTGKAVGVIGLGRIGMAIVKRVEAFSCPISYHSRTQKHEVSYKFYPSVIELASNSQILVVACQLTDETRHIINHQVIEALGPKGIVINIGRGAQIDETELVSALVEGRLGGAGLDVFEHEPHVAEELLGLDNVVLSPHVGTATVETRKAMADLVLGNLEAYFLRNPLLTPVCESFIANSTLPELGLKIR